jgi:hypothetical protein
VKRKAALIAVLAIVLASAIGADDHIVDADRTVDFATITTFALRPASVAVNNPEVNNPVVLSNITNTIRTALVSKRVQERQDNADVTVEFVISEQDYAIGPYGRAIPLDPSRGARGRGRANEGRVAFTEGILIVDMTARQSGLLIWRGVYRDSEKDASKFAQKLADDAKTLLAQYPPAKK